MGGGGVIGMIESYLSVRMKDNLQTNKISSKPTWLYFTAYGFILTLHIIILYPNVSTGPMISNQFHCSDSGDKLSPSVIRNVTQGGTCSIALTSVECWESFELFQQTIAGVEFLKVNVNLNLLWSWSWYHGYGSCYQFFYIWCEKFAWIMAKRQLTRHLKGSLSCLEILSYSFWLFYPVNCLSSKAQMS